MALLVAGDEKYEQARALIEELYFILGAIMTTGMINPVMLLIILDSFNCDIQQFVDTNNSDEVE